jgi:hypothetical protein
MSAPPPEASAPEISLDLVPVRYRVDGWTAEKQRDLILVPARFRDRRDNRACPTTLSAGRGAAK